MSLLLRYHPGLRAVAFLVSVLVVAVFILPDLYLVYSSLRPDALLLRPVPDWSPVLTLSHYAAIFQNPSFPIGQYLANSVEVASGATLLALAVGIPAAYSMARFDTGGQNLAFWVLSLRMLPPIVFIVPVYILAQKVGLLDTPYVLMIVLVTVNVPLTVWVLRSYIGDIPLEIEHSARVDGASTGSILWNLVVPLSLPGIASVAILDFIFSWNAFTYPFMLTLTNATTLTIGAAKFITAFGILWGDIFAASAVAVVPMMLLGLLVQRYLIRGLTLGAVTMGRTHARAWQQAGVRVACVVDGLGERARSLAQEVKAHACADVKEALARHPEATVVDICVPTDAHSQVLENVPDGRRLVVMEKPLAPSWPQAQAMVARAHERGIPLASAHVLRYFPAYRALHQAALEGGVQGVRHVRLRRLAPTPPAASGWYLDEAKSGGIFFDLMLHDLDWVLWTLGTPKVVQARAFRRPGGPALHAVAVLTYPEEALVHVEASWMHPGPFTAWAEVDATWGTVSMPEEDAPFRLARLAPEEGGTQGGGGVVVPGTVGTSPYALELRDALKAFREGRQLPVTAEEGLRAVRLAALCRVSAQRGEPVFWEEDPA
jgi:multiple sugar transport system permease protein